MKQVVCTALLLTALVFWVPLLLFGGTGLGENDTPPALLQPDRATASPQQDSARTVRLLRTETGVVEELPLSDYLWGVVAAEMPASFHSEALKAQTIAARTYTLQRENSAVERHPEATVCDDHTCCQAYLTLETARTGWGEQATFYEEKLRTAVAETDGLVVLYEGQLIDAVFHSSSEGSTADAAQVWGTRLPYLVPVDTPEGEEVPNFHTTVTVPLEEFQTTILQAHPEVILGEDYTAWFGAVEYNDWGGVACLPVGGVEVSGTEYRTLFGLRSTRFALRVGESGVTFSVTGYGHGAGMSQYGANAMAAAGSEAAAILTHYYTGCTVELYSEQGS